MFVPLASLVRPASADASDARAGSAEGDQSSALLHEIRQGRKLRPAAPARPSQPTVATSSNPMLSGLMSKIHERRRIAHEEAEGDDDDDEANWS